MKIVITVLCGAKATFSEAKATLSVAKATLSVARVSRVVATAGVVAKAIAGVVAKATAGVVATVRQSDHLLESVPKKQLVIS